MKKKYISPLVSSVELYAEQQILTASIGVDGNTTGNAEDSYTRRRRGFGKSSPWEQDPEDE